MLMLTYHNMEQLMRLFASINNLSQPSLVFNCQRNCLGDSSCWARCK